MYHNFIAKTDQLGVLKILLMSNFNYPVFNEQSLVFDNTKWSLAGSNR